MTAPNEPPVDCQACGARVPTSQWAAHISRHFADRSSILPAVEAFERHATMTDRIIAFTVTLELDTRDDDAEPVAEAIRRLRGVTSVVPVVANVHDYFAVETARQKLVSELYDVLSPRRKPREPA